MGRGEFLVEMIFEPTSQMKGQAQPKQVKIAASKAMGHGMGGREGVDVEHSQEAAFV